ncbi:MAG: hypothetical protein QXT13_09585 [Pyrobaculum sp.]
MPEAEKQREEKREQEAVVDENVKKMQEAAAKINELFKKYVEAKDEEERQRIKQEIIELAREYTDAFKRLIRERLRQYEEAVKVREKAMRRYKEALLLRSRGERLVLA